MSENDDEEDLKKKFEKLKAKAEQDDILAMFTIGIFYELGVGVKKDLKQALKWYKKSTKAGNATAMFKVGLCYRDGNGVTRNLKKAFEWHKKAFEAEHPDLQPYQTIFALETANAKDKIQAIDTLRGLEIRINDFLKTGKEDDQRPKTIAHYTNWQTLWKILGNDERKGTLRLAPAQYMNDPQEGKFFF